MSSTRPASLAATTSPSTPSPLPHYDPKTSSVETTDFAAIIAGVKDLGLRLEPSKADTLVLNLDHIDRPPTD